MLRARSLTFKPILQTLEDRQCPSYAILDLGTLGGTFSVAADINGSQQVVGMAKTVGDVAQRAFLWQSGTMADLGTLGGQNSGANALNNAAQVVGGAETGAFDPDGHAISHACLWQNGTMTDLGTLGGSNSSALDVNSTSQIVGSANTGAIDPNGFPIHHAFLWQNGVMTDLNTQLPANSGWVLDGATGINDSGQIAGSGYHNSQIRAYLFSNGAITDLGSLLNGGGSQARDINASGQVVGFTATNASTYQHAFVYSGGVMSDLGTINGGNSSLSDARAINSSAQIVGTSSWGNWRGPLDPKPLHAILWKNNTKTDLNKLLPNHSAWELTSAEGIDNAGAIVGLGTIGGQSHAFLLTPTMSAFNGPSNEPTGRDFDVGSRAESQFQAFVGEASVGRIIEPTRFEPALAPGDTFGYRCWAAGRSGYADTTPTFLLPAFGEEDEGHDGNLLKNGIQLEQG